MQLFFNDKFVILVINEVYVQNHRTLRRPKNGKNEKKTKTN